MKDFIESSQADIVFLQEVVGKNTKYEKKGIIDSQFEYLADQLWPHFSYGQNAVYDHGHHGNVILSKFPIEHHQNIDLSTNKHEKRGLLLCKIQIPHPGQPSPSYFYAACSHLNLLHRGRLKQYQKIKKHLLHTQQGGDVPLVIAGDFNDWNKKAINVFEGDLKMQEVHKTMHGQFARTFPAFLPFLHLDRIYVKNATVKQAERLKPKRPFSFFRHLSDHLPLFCEVEIHPSFMHH